MSTKKIRAEITERKQRARAQRKEEHARRPTHGNVRHADLSSVIATIEARDAGLTVEEWQALPESEQIRLQEDRLDSIYARENHRTTLEAYRQQKRREIEAGELLPQYGFPQWLRDEYAQERPAETVVEYLNLLTEGATATGPALQEILKKIQARTASGFVGAAMTFPEAKQRLLAEIERVGLTELFGVAVAEAKRGGTIQ
jgi:hypothetical protein